MSPAITMTEAIAALVTEKRATGYKYHSEQQVLTRFAAFCASEFPGQQAPTRASVEAWITAPACAASPRRPCTAWPRR